MRDLRFLTVNELERFLVNLQHECKMLQSPHNDHTTKMMKQNQELIAAVEAEILERTLLGIKNEDGSSE